MTLTQTGNVNVIEEAQLGQVKGGHRGGHRRRYDNYCYDRRRHNDCYDNSYGYEGKGYDCSYEYDSNDYDNDYCDRRYS
jgi:hypothetical protein